MPDRGPWRKEQLEWYHSPQFEKVHWWPNEQKKRQGIPGEPVALLWEVFRRHPDTGRLLHAIREANVCFQSWKSWFAALIGPKSRATRIVWLLMKSGERSWTSLRAGQREFFKKSALALIQSGRISPTAAISNPDPVWDLLEAFRCADMPLQGVPHKLRRMTREGAVIARKFMLGSWHEMTIQELVHSISARGQDLMIVAIERDASIELVQERLKLLLQSKRGTQLLADHGGFFGSHSDRSKTYSDPPPPEELVSLVRTQNPGISFHIKKYRDGSWSVSWQFEIDTRKREPIARSRWRAELQGTLESLDSKERKKYSSVRRVMERFQLLSLGGAAVETCKKRNRKKPLPTKKTS